MYCSGGVKRDAEEMDLEDAMDAAQPEKRCLAIFTCDMYKTPFKGCCLVMQVELLKF